MEDSDSSGTHCVSTPIMSFISMWRASIFLSLSRRFCSSAHTALNAMTATTENEWMRETHGRKRTSDESGGIQLVHIYMVKSWDARVEFPHFIYCPSAGGGKKRKGADLVPPLTGA